MRYTVQYADPLGAYPLADDAAWRTFSRTDDADMALSDVPVAGRRHRPDGYPRSRWQTYAVRILHGDDVLVVDVPREVFVGLDVDEVGELVAVIYGDGAE